MLESAVSVRLGARTLAAQIDAPLALPCDQIACEMARLGATQALAHGSAEIANATVR